MKPWAVVHVGDVASCFKERIKDLISWCNFFGKQLSFFFYCLTSYSSIVSTSATGSRSIQYCTFLEFLINAFCTSYCNLLFLCSERSWFNLQKVCTGTEFFFFFFLCFTVFNPFGTVPSEKLSIAKSITEVCVRVY